VLLLVVAAGALVALVTAFEVAGETVEVVQAAEDVFSLLVTLVVALVVEAEDDFALLVDAAGVVKVEEAALLVDDFLLLVVWLTLADEVAEVQTEEDSALVVVGCDVSEDVVVWWLLELRGVV